MARLRLLSQIKGFWGFADVPTTTPSTYHSLPVAHCLSPITHCLCPPTPTPTPNGKWCGTATVVQWQQQ